jgi:hypothetical protein
MASGSVSSGTTIASTSRSEHALTNDAAASAARGLLS